MPPCKQGAIPVKLHLVAATKMNDAERVQAAIEAGIRVCVAKTAYRNCRRGMNRTPTMVQTFSLSAHCRTNKVKVPDRQGFADSVGRLGSSRRGYRQGKPRSAVFVRIFFWR